MGNKLSAGLLIVAATLFVGGLVTDYSTEAIAETEATQTREAEQHVNELREVFVYEDGEALFTTEQLSEMLCSDGWFSTCYAGEDKPVNSLTYYGTTTHTYKDSNETVTVQLVGTPQGPVVVEVSE